MMTMKNMLSKISQIVLGITLLLIAAVAGAVWLALAEPEDPTANWQTFRNEEYGYEVKYPSDWELFDTFAPFEVHFYHPSYNPQKTPIKEQILIAIMAEIIEDTTDD
jgi:hypothetical protein